jgi:hypothetical protein
MKFFKYEVSTWEGTTDRKVPVAVLAAAAAGVGRKEVERESAMADDLLPSLSLFFASYPLVVVAMRILFRSLFSVNEFSSACRACLGSGFYFFWFGLVHVCSSNGPRNIKSLAISYFRVTLL